MSTALCKLRLFMMVHCSPCAVEATLCGLILSTSPELKLGILDLQAYTDFLGKLVTAAAARYTPRGAKCPVWKSRLSFLLCQTKYSKKEERQVAVKRKCGSVTPAPAFFLWGNKKLPVQVRSRFVG